MLRRTTQRRYFHTIPQDLVPEGWRSSKFQSSGTPSRRTDTTLEYQLAPAFGAPGPRLAVLAINTRHAARFQMHHREGLHAAICECVPSLRREGGTDTFEDIAPRELILSPLLKPRECPWGAASASALGSSAAAAGRARAARRIPQHFHGIEVCLELPSSVADIDRARQLFDLLQRELLESVVEKKKALAAAHRIVDALPFANPLLAESVPTTWMGADIPDARVDEALRRWAEREKAIELLEAVAPGAAADDEKISA